MRQRWFSSSAAAGSWTSSADRRRSRGSPPSGQQRQGHAFSEKRLPRLDVCPCLTCAPPAPSGSLRRDVAAEPAFFGSRTDQKRSFRPLGSGDAERIIDDDLSHATGTGESRLISVTAWPPRRTIESRPPIASFDQHHRRWNATHPHGQSIMKATRKSEIKNAPLWGNRFS